MLKRFGFGPIAVVEPKPERRGMAVALGAEVAPPDADDGKRYTIVLEASGRDAGRQMALERVAPLGAVVQLGESDRWSLQETRAVRRKDFYLIRSFYFAQHEWTQNLDLFRADRDAYARLVGPRVGLQGLAETFQSFARGDCIKPTLEFAV